MKDLSKRAFGWSVVGVVGFAALLAGGLIWKSESDYNAIVRETQEKLKHQERQLKLEGEIQNIRRGS